MCRKAIAKEYQLNNEFILAQEPARNFTSLTVWKQAHALTLEIYRLSGELPDDEKFGLRKQMQRAMVSVPANIAEGFKREGRMDKSRFYNIAQSSLEEVRYYLILVNDLFKIPTEDYQMKLEDVSKLLDAYISSMLTKTKYTRY